MRATGLLVCALMALALSPHAAYAQGGATSSISGVVTDSGAVIPGADILAKNNATSAESRAVSTENGTFTVPALNAGTYTVTVTLRDSRRSCSTTSCSMPACRPRSSSSGSRRTRRNRRRVRPRARSCRRSRRRSSSTLSVNQITQAAAHEPRRAAVRRQPARREHAGRQPRLHGERPAAERDQHHARRHEHPGQLPEDDRRLLRAPRARGSTRSRKSP